MMDPAAAAAQSWPDTNPAFRRPWAMPPPQTRKRPVPGETSSRAKSGSNSGSTASNTATAAAQRAIAFAQRRAAEIDRTADLLLSIGRHIQAERLANLAAELRGVAV